MVLGRVKNEDWVKKILNSIALNKEDQKRDERARILLVMGIRRDSLTIFLQMCIYIIPFGPFHFYAVYSLDLT